MIVVGISGYKKSGKDTTALLLEKLLIDKRVAVKITHFADVLKQELCTAYPHANKDLFHNPDLKDKQSKEICLGHCLDLNFAYLAVKAGITTGESLTPRRVMVMWAEEYRKPNSPTYFTDQIRKLAVRLVDDVELLLIPDCRFLVESSLIKSMGGYLIRVINDSVRVEKEDSTEREHLLMPVDDYVKNSGSLEVLRKQIKSVVLPNLQTFSRKRLIGTTLY